VCVRGGGRRKREREREREIYELCVGFMALVCVCVRERMGERDSEKV